MKIAYTYEEAANQVGVSVSTIKINVASGELIARKIGKLVRIEHTELVSWFQALPTK